MLGDHENLEVMQNLLDIQKMRIRKKIDALDDKIMPLLAERYQLCRELLEMKDHNREKLIDDQRRKEIIEKAGGVYGDPEVQTYVMRVYSQLLDSAVDIFMRRRRSWWERLWFSSEDHE
ncbi:MAG: chorismate mutase [Bdellovibrionaceae bacterium]|nr:chorismate mutase [Pseudobdellovibrionaceae bacterium]